jgi:hypothetical protein
MEAKIKSQDILILLKIVSLTRSGQDPVPLRTEGWQDWLAEYDPHFEGLDQLGGPTRSKSDDADHGSQFSVRALAESTGISKSQVGLSLQRCHEVGLALENRDGHGLQVFRRGLCEFLIYGIRFVFPAKAGAMTRGIATGVAAPVFAGKLFSGGDDKPVWPYASGNTKGQAVEPLTKSVPAAVENDAMLYALLALVDSLRIGAARERKMAEDQLSRMLGVRK